MFLVKNSYLNRPKNKEINIIATKYSKLYYIVILYIFSLIYRIKIRKERKEVLLKSS